MAETKVIQFKRLGNWNDAGAVPPAAIPAEADSDSSINRLEPSTCTEAQTFALQVLDDSMEPEFKKGCIVIVDPTGLARDGSYVLAQRSEPGKSEPTNKEDPDEILEQYLFRHLHQTEDKNWKLCALNEKYPIESTQSDFSEIVGVIVQRAGTRRRYHKRYD